MADIVNFDRSNLTQAETVQVRGIVDARADCLELKEFQTLWDLYAKCAMNGTLSDLAKRFEFNEFIRPKVHNQFSLQKCSLEVGDILLTIPATYSSKWTRRVQCNYNPNFHYAPVVTNSILHF